jgi:hypothetical protein
MGTTEVVPALRGALIAPWTFFIFLLRQGLAM